MVLLDKALNIPNSGDRGISAAILSGGSGRRLGGVTKANLTVGGRTILEHIMDAFTGIFSDVILVTNTPAEFNAAGILKIVPDIIRGAGPLGGIHAALNASVNDAVFIVAGDMPLLNSELISQQLDIFLRSRPDALIPQIGKYIEPLHSVYKKSVLPELEGFLRKREKLAVWEFLQCIKSEYFKPENEPEASDSFLSFNSPEDAAFIEKLISNRGLKKYKK